MLKKFFLKRFNSYFLIMVIPVFIVLILMGNYLFSTQQKSLEQKGITTINSFEETLMASTYNMGFQIDTMMSNTYFSYFLKNLLTNTRLDQTDVLFYNNIKSFFSTFERANPYVHSIYLYIDGKNKFMTSSSGQIANVNTYYDIEWLEYYKNMDEDKKVYVVRRWIEPDSFSEPIEIITVFYRNTYIDGVIVINIDKSKYGTLLRNVITSDYQTIIWYNGDGDFVCTADQTFETMKVENDLAGSISEIVKTGDIENIQNKWINVDEKYYYIYGEYTEFMDLYQVSAIPFAYVLSETKIYIYSAITVLVVILILVAILAYMYTNRSFVYIKECINIFSAAERGEIIENKVSDINDEYSLILNNIIYLYIKNSKMQIDLREKQHQNEITEMTALQLQINPHFIFNTLQIMDMEIIRNLGTNSNVHKMTQQLASVVKYALSNPTDDVLLKKELEYLQAYLDIQKVRYNDRTITLFEVDDSVLECKVFRLILQPILENCFEHGRESDEKSIVIKLKILDKGDHIKFAVIDNGKGIDRQGLIDLRKRINSNDSENIGLTNLNRRLILRYGENYALKILSRENIGMIVSFNVPK